MLYGLSREVILCSRECQAGFNPEVYRPPIKTVVMAMIGEGMSDELLQRGRDLAKEYKVPFLEIREEDRLAADQFMRAIVSNDLFVTKSQKSTCIIN